jgi:hypothetical protein
MLDSVPGGQVRLTVTELLEVVVNWRMGLIVLVVFGFAPGAMLRLIVLAFHRDGPRRSEMLAELHRRPRLERPLWVVAQMEVALFEGIWERVVWAATGRIIERWHLNSGVKLNRKNPKTFGSLTRTRSRPSDRAWWSSACSRSTTSGDGRCGANACGSRSSPSRSATSSAGS